MQSSKSGVDDINLVGVNAKGHVDSGMAVYLVSQ